MTAQDCLEELRRIKDAAFATVDETGAPQVRIIDVMLAEAGALYFCTARGKEFYRQLTADGRVAVTALNRDWQMFRLSGRARRLTEQQRRTCSLPDDRLGDCAYSGAACPRDRTAALYSGRPARYNCYK